MSVGHASGVILRPVVTEKSSSVLEHGQVVFRVRRSATKPEIRRAVEELFKVKVVSVNTLIAKGKKKRLRGVLGRRSDVKKAIVTLQPGQSIDIGAGV